MRLKSKGLGIAFALAALALSACATAPVPPPGTSTPVGPPTIPSTAFDLGGDWRRAQPERVLADFQSGVTRRYGVGLELGAVVADLRRASFTCAANRDTRGDPPAQICRRTATEAGCTHTWQVYLYDGDAGATLARTRGAYDRRCGGDGLLGG